MIKKLIILFASFIISLPLFADPQILLNTDVDGQLSMKRYYNTIAPENDITNGSYFIDEDGVHDDIIDVINPFNISAGFTTHNFIVTFFGSVETDQSQEISVSNSSYYYKDGENKIYISLTPNIINKVPSTGILTFVTGQYYDLANPSLPEFTFQIQSPAYSTIPAGRYYTDITISIVGN